MKRFTKKDAQLIASIFDNEGMEYALIDGGHADDLLKKVPGVWEAVLEFKRAHSRLSARLEDAGVEEP